MEKLGISVGCGMVLGFVFAVLSLLFREGGADEHGILFCLGFFVGLVGAPEIFPEHFRNAAMFQTSSGAIAGLFGGLAFSTSLEAAILGLLLGGLLGWLAPYWVKHVRIP